MWHLSPGFGQCLGFFLNKNAWAFQWAYRSGEENTYMYIYIHTHIHMCIYINTYLFYLYTFDSTPKITSDSWWFFVCNLPGSNQATTFFFQPEALEHWDFLGPTVPGATEQFAKEAFARVEAWFRKAFQGGFRWEKTWAERTSEKNVTSKWSRLKRLGKNLQCKVYTYICNMYILYTQCKVKVVQHVLLTPPVAPNSTGFSINYLLVAELYPAVAPKIWNLNHKSLDSRLSHD